MNQLLATAVRGDPADNVTGEVADAVIAAPVIAAPVMPVFVDASGRRRKLVTGLGWLVALACVAYLGVIGVSMTGTSVGPLPDLPSVASRTVVFGSETAGLPQGALEAPVPAPPAPVAAAAPDWAGAARSPPAQHRGAQGRAAAWRRRPRRKRAAKTAPKVMTSRRSAPQRGADASLDRRTSSSARTGGASR